MHNLRDKYYMNLSEISIEKVFLFRMLYSFSTRHFNFIDILSKFLKLFYNNCKQIKNKIFLKL